MMGHVTITQEPFEGAVSPVATFHVVV